MNNAITEYIDLAQLSLYAFWIFFAGLIYRIRLEDRREGYPLESDTPRRVGSERNFLIPKPKTYLRPDGSEYQAPDFKRDERDINAEKLTRMKGSPFDPTGDPLQDGVGPAAYCERHDTAELTREGHVAIVPLRVASDYSISAGPDPRGWDVVGADGELAGTVKDIWVDRAEMIVRYLEVTLPVDGEGGEGAGETRLLPINVSVVRRSTETVEVSAIKAAQFTNVPALKSDEQVTEYEEERVMAYFAGGYLYADPRRAESLV